jgi:hypothetical protein
MPTHPAFTTLVADRNGGDCGEPQDPHQHAEHRSAGRGVHLREWIAVIDSANGKRFTRKHAPHTTLTLTSSIMGVAVRNSLCVQARVCKLCQRAGHP